MWPTMWNILRRTEYPESDPRTLAEETFQKLLRLEWKRSHRSHRRFVLMLLEAGTPGAINDPELTKLLRVLPDSTRDTDIVGWYKDRSVLGVIFTEIGSVDERTVRSVLCAKIAKVLRSTLSDEQASQVRLSFQLFPDAEATEDTRVAARYRDVMRAPRHEESPSSNEVFALKATNSSS